MVWKRCFEGSFAAAWETVQLALLTKTMEKEGLTDMYSIALDSFSLLRATITTFAPF